MPKNKIYLLIGGLILVFLCMVILLLSYYLYKQDQDSAVGQNAQESEQEDSNANEEEASNDNDAEEVKDSPNTVAFAGTYVSATVPDGWTVTEYEDGAGGYGMLSDGVYDGLTAITVSNPAGNVVFKIEGVNGIGGTGECGQIYTFADTEAAYVIEQQNLATGMGSPLPPTVALAGQNYVEFELLGMQGRFLGNAAYWNVAAAGSGVFNPACNMLQIALENPGLGFEYTQSGNTNIIGTYMPNTTGDFDYAQADELAEILSSLVVN